MGTAHKANSRIGWPHLNDGTGRAKDVLAQFCRSRILSRELDDFRLMLRIWVRVVLQAAHAIRTAREALCHACQSLELENSRCPSFVGELHPSSLAL